MKYPLLLVLALCFSINTATADVIDDLKDLLEQSETFKETAVDCYLAMKIQKSDGWNMSACNNYKALATSIWDYKTQVEVTTKSFRHYAKADEGSRSRIKRGLKYLIIMEANMETLVWFSNKFKALGK